MLRNSYVAFKALLLSLLLIASPLALAEPTAANQQMQMAQLNFMQVKLQFQMAQNYLATGNINLARQSFISAQVSAQLLNMSVMQLKMENTDTLNNGQYVHRAPQERAVAYSELASLDALQLSVQLSVLAQQPTSYGNRIQAQIAIQQLTLSLQQCAQEMAAAQ
ncbi:MULTISPECIES: hypothetical protein [unclassified Lysobacter]|uniref:hypothetical protein n=1 Tax=unclassified Lysobacter TaxID=2635362 RepID=UPI000701E0F3|nr:MULTISPECIES: hypothetical protein [unclassified Lysobacter]KQZ66255.1 hypothetical protein ASD53_17725 [Lysobacter sp. Root559]KRA72753.1 hypothetical protein ASD78_14065 [Lysobacter sp. Root667]KRC30957.1 hypothetical protein ASE10_18950 [Lysobacter sp. Root76]KRD67745.1 hypothetical protein ASE45_13445 [Lysobacter sp. Root96]